MNVKTTCKFVMEMQHAQTQMVVLCAHALNVTLVME